MNDAERRDQERREDKALKRAKKERRLVSYLDKDGCEVTATPSGHVFYNAADWW